MARRKDVFQSKVLQKLYSAPPTLEKQTSTPSIEALAKKINVKRKTSSDDAVFGKKLTTVNPSQKIYTVLPPPPGHSIHLKECASLPQPESDSGIAPAVTCTAAVPASIRVTIAKERHHENSEESDKSTEANERKKRRRKRKRHAAAPHSSGKDGAVPYGESAAGQTPVAQRDECTSKNRKRKMKKKRHKEKLKSMGQRPRAAALEFTFQQVEEEGSKRRTADLIEFLRKTAEIYLSDPSQQREQLLHLSASVDDLIDSIACGSKATAVTKQLFCLKTFAEQSKTENLENALKELSNNSILTAEETAAVISLFRYWITDILPIQAEETRTSAT